MDRKKKLYLICGAVLILIVFIVAALILSAQKRNTPILVPEPDPVETIEPEDTPGPLATPTATAALPTPAVQLPEATMPEPPDTGETSAPTLTPKPTAKSTTVPSVELPSGTSDGNKTPKPAATPKPTAEAVAGFDFSLPVRANARASVTIAANTTNVESVVWEVSKKGFLGIQADAGSDATGTLTKEGGTLAFATAGTYTVTATAKTAKGETVKVSHDIEIKAADNFNFSMPLTAYTDTVVHVQVVNGEEAAAWAVMKESSEIQAGDAFVGTLDKLGGYIVFQQAGTYTLIGTSRAGKEIAVSITVAEKRA